MALPVRPGPQRHRSGTVNNKVFFYSCLACAHRVLYVSNIYFIEKCSSRMSTSLKLTLELHQVLRLPHRMTRRLDPRHI